LGVLLRMADHMGVDPGRGEQVDEELQQAWPPGTFTSGQPNRGVVYPGEGQSQADRQPVSWDGYVNAAAAEGGPSVDPEFAHLFPPGSQAEDDRRHAEADRYADAHGVQARAYQRVEDMADEELHRLLFGDSVYEPGGAEPG
jgi:hypothetical protein